ncbi:DNA primase [PVC group bacterium]|nr:DNA primase [PVC group bacterium]
MGHRIPERVIDDIRFHSDIVEVIGSHITLKRAGSSYKACCPFHKEKTPSFMVNPSRQSFKCFGCGEGGNVFSFLMKHQGVDFVTAVKILADRAGIPLELEEDREGGQRKILYEIHKEIAEFYQRCLEQMRGAESARTYLKERDLFEPEALKDFQIGYAPDRWDAAVQWAEKHNYSMDQMVLAGLLLKPNNPDSKIKYYDRFRNRLMFPIHDSQSRVIGFSGRVLSKEAKAAKYVNSPETPIFHKGRVIYAMDKARRHIVGSKLREAIICEGQIDVVRCHRAGFEMAVAAQGTAFTPDHVKVIKRYADGVILAFDSDEAGQNAAIKTATIFMDAGLIVRVAALPAGEDPDSFIRDKGAKAFQALLDEARSIVGFQVDVLSSREKSADSVSAVNRIAKAVLEVITHSPNAVQRARLMQDAAKRLNLPEKALEEDLEKLKTEKKKYSRSRPPAEEPPPFMNEDDMFEPVEDPEYYASVVAGENTVAPVTHESAPPLEEMELCRHMIHLIDHPELAELIKKYLPLEMMRDENCRMLVSATLEAQSTGKDISDVINALETENDVLSNFVQELEKSPSKAGKREYTRIEAVKDIILDFWEKKLKKEWVVLCNRDEEKMTKEEFNRRTQLTHDVNVLKNKEWAGAGLIIELELII